MSIIFCEAVAIFGIIMAFVFVGKLQVNFGFIEILLGSLSRILCSRVRQNVSDIVEISVFVGNRQMLMCCNDLSSVRLIPIEQ